MWLCLKVPLITCSVRRVRVLPGDRTLAPGFRAHGPPAGVEPSRSLQFNDELLALFGDNSPYRKELRATRLEIVSPVWSTRRSARALLPGNGADRQRHVAEREDFNGLLSWLVAETEVLGTKPNA